MKKSLSLILAIAMVFSMFASVAFAADASLDTTAKYEALKTAGIFEGTTGDKPALEEKMTRAQFAKVIVKLLGLQEDAASASIFNDLTAAGWASGFIGAAVKAGLVDGVAPGKFDPSADVSTEQLAKLLVLGLKLQPSNDPVTGNVSAWAKGYVAAAVKAGLIPASSDYTKPALRGALVDATYAGKNYVAPTAKVSVTEAKAAGVYKVEVKFNKAVDDTKAVLELKKGSLKVGTTTTWSADKKVATLALDTRVTAGDYTVTLSGLDAATVDKTTATFTAEDEQVSKIDFVNANDSVAYSANATFKVKASNQYGEAVSLGASSFTALVSGQAPTSFKKDSDGNFVITANISGITGITQGNGLVPVTVYYNNSSVTVSKNFKVGTVPILSKIEADKVTYSNNGKSLIEADETASIFLKLYDQYGNPVVKAQFTTGEILAANINPVITPYEQKLEVVKAGSTFAVGDLFDENDKARVKIKLTSKLDKTADYTVNIYGGSSSATATVSVGAANLATKIEFDTSALTVSATDLDVYVPIIATDANGTKLSAQDIVDNQNNNDRFLFQVAGGTATIQQTGEHKGKVHLNFTTANTVGTKLFVSGQIKNSLNNTFTQTTINVGDYRVPDRITVTTEPSAKAILGADDEIKYQLKDQYGKDISALVANVPETNGQTSKYRVVVKVTTEGAGTTAAPKTAPSTAASVSGNTTTYTFLNTELAAFNAGFNFNTDGSEGKVTVKATVERAPNGTSNFSDYSASVSRTLEAVKSDVKLTYSLETIGDLYAAQDKLASIALGGDALTAGNSQFDKKVKVVAKDSAGNKVKLPLNYIQGISVSDPNSVASATYTTGGVQDAYIIGNKAGKATVSAIVYTNKGDTVNLTQEVTVKADAIVVDKLTAGKTTIAYDAAKTFAYEYFTKDADNQLKVVDQYGIEYQNADIAKYDAVLGVRYTVSTTNGTGAVTIDAKTGEITSVPSTVLEFQITAIAPNGKSVSVVVSK